MNILILDAYFHPEKTAYTHLEDDLIEEIIADGHNIFVICPIPTRSIDDETRKRYRTIKRESLYEKKLNITRFWAPKEKKNPVIRAIRYLWCNIRTYQIAVKCKDIDVVFSSSTPPTQGMLAGMVAKKLSNKYREKVPFVYNLQDIFPDSLVSTKLTKEGSIFYKIGRKIENYTYKLAEKIIVISQGFKANVLRKGVSEEKVVFISNWIDLESVFPIERENNTLIDEFGIDSNKFIVSYAGNFGEAQGADIILKVAVELKDYSDILFVIFGGGSCFENAKIEAANCNNVFIHELLSLDRLSEVYSLGNVALITCKANTGSAGLPSKLWSVMACNTPVIASFDKDSDLAVVLNESGAGVCVPPEEVLALKNEILNRYAMWKQGSEVAINSREYVEKIASKKKCVRRYIEELFAD